VSLSFFIINVRDTYKFAVSPLHIKIYDRDLEYVEFDTVANLKEPLIAKVS
jgi:hypothetical protein